MGGGRFPAYALGALSFFSCSSPLNLSQYEQRKPLVAGVDGWWSNDLENLADRMNRAYDVPVKIVDVHHWKENMEVIREAYKQDRKIILMGFSAGCHQVGVLTARQCEREKIPIELILLFDPTYTNGEPLYLPSNVSRIVVYFSSDENDILAGVRGNPDNIPRSTRIRIEVKKKRGTHLNYVNWDNFQSDLESYVNEYTVATGGDSLGF